MTSIGLWLREAQLRVTALGRGLLALVAFVLSLVALSMLSERAPAWDRWLAAQIQMKVRPPVMRNDIVLVHVGKSRASDGQPGRNTFEDRRAVATFLTHLGDQAAGRPPAAIVLDMVFRKERDQPPPPSAEGAASAVHDSRSGFARIDAALTALRERLGEDSLFAVLDPFEMHGDQMYFDSAEPWRHRDLALTETRIHHGHTAIDVDADCTVGVTWPAVNVQTHPTPAGVVPTGPTGDVEALAPKVVRRKFDRERHSPVYFIAAGGSDADIVAFDPIRQRMHRFDGTRNAGLGVDAAVDWGGKIVIVGDAVDDRLKRVGMSCSPAGIVLLGRLMTDSSAPTPTSRLLEPSHAAVGWLLGMLGALFAHGIAGRRTSYFHPVRAWLLGALGGLLIVAAVVAGYTLSQGSLPGLVLPAAVVLAATSVSTWFYRRIRTAACDIFVSYKRGARTDPPQLVRWIDLTLRGIPLAGGRRANVFLDVRQLEVTQHWKTQAKRRIGESKVFVAVLTHEYVEQVARSLATLRPEQSPDDVERLDACCYEIFYAMRRLDSGLRIFPVLLPDVRIPVEHDMLRQLGEHVGMKVEGGELDLRAFRARIRKVIDEFSESDWAASRTSRT